MNTKPGAQVGIKGIGAKLAGNSNLLLALMFVATMVFMIIPLPVVLLDFLLALSITSGLVVLLVGLYINKPLDFGVFPSVLLLSTAFRFGLNIITSRGILLHGADPQGGVSRLVTAFAEMFIRGDFVVGITMFVIIMVFNFVVITKGAGRIAEVAARFTLDAMPGKQMAIDAELNAGHISAEEARRRRSAVEREADFYGAMDGASKFVRGEGIAAVLITVTNLIVGFLLGVVRHNMGAAEAAARFTVLTVGDGLVTAVPALMVSLAAGMIVTRSAGEGQIGDQMTNQFRMYPKVFYVAAGLASVVAILPGFPFVAFAAMGGVLGFLGRQAQLRLTRESEMVSQEKSLEEKRKDEKSESNLDNLMRLDSLAVEVGHALVGMIDPSQDGEVVDRIQGIRKQFAQDLGIIVPQIQLRDNLQLDPGQYVIQLKGNRIASGSLMVDYFLAMDPGNVELPIEGETTVDPVYGLPALWVHRRDKDDAVFRGYTVVNGPTVIATHITKVLKEYSADLLTRQDVQYLVDRLKESNPKVVDEVIAADRLSLGDVVRVLQNLLREDIPVRDLLTVFETLADHCKLVKNPDVLSEQVRRSLGRTIVQRYAGERDGIAVVTFDRLVEDVLSGGLVTLDSGASYLNLDPRSAQDVLQKLMKAVGAFEQEGQQPVVVIAARLRQSFQRLIGRYLPHVAVLSYDEIPAGTNVRNLEMVS